MFSCVKQIFMCVIICAHGALWAAAPGVEGKKALRALCLRDFHGGVVISYPKEDYPAVAEQAYTGVKDAVERLLAPHKSGTCSHASCAEMKDSQWVLKILKKIVYDNTYLIANQDVSSFNVPLYCPLVKSLLGIYPQALDYADLHTAENLKVLGLLDINRASRKRTLKEQWKYSTVEKFNEKLPISTVLDGDTGKIKSPDRYVDGDEVITPRGAKYVRFIDIFGVQTVRRYEENKEDNVHRVAQVKLRAEKVQKLKVSGAQEAPCAASGFADDDEISMLKGQPVTGKQMREMKQGLANILFGAMVNLNKDEDGSVQQIEGDERKDNYRRVVQTITAFDPELLSQPSAAQQLAQLGLAPADDGVAEK